MSSHIDARAGDCNALEGVDGRDEGDGGVWRDGVWCASSFVGKDFDIGQLVAVGRLRERG